MDERWNILPDARRVLQHEDDSRPAWLWSQDGRRLIWSNEAANLFGAKLKKHGLKLADPAVPIKGQVARIIRLGSKGRSSLARIQFLAGEKPISETCATTPLTWENDEPVLLIVGVDAIADDIFAAACTEPDEPAIDGGEVPAPPALRDLSLPGGAQSDQAAPIEADQAYQHELQSWHDVDAETAYETAPQPGTISVTDRPEDWLDDLGEETEPGVGDDTSEAPTQFPAGEAAGALIAEDEANDQAAPADTSETDNETASVDVSNRLSALVERLAADEALYAPLGEQDDVPPVQPNVAGAEDDRESTSFYKVTGRGLRRADQFVDDDVPTQQDVQDDSPAEADPETVERVSRYNFDELSRILADRVGDRNGAPAPAAPAPMPRQQATSTSSGALINLGGETLVLNRLPLGILVFRDQEVLFANRAITEMVGYESAEGLREAGLAAIFPIMGPEGQEAGPVNHLVQRDGTLVPVTARLQSIAWRGRPALMLSASTTEVRTGHEDAVKAFAQTFADIRGDGFLEATRNGVVSTVNGAAVALLSHGKVLPGRALSDLIGQDDVVALRAFLERPARFAETARPCLTLRAQDGRADIMLFALGQAGIVSGYFGLVTARQSSPARISGSADVDPALLGRISRGVRRPLNTVIGFSDIIRSKTFGALEEERYATYADDIAQAGQEISALVDELDDYARLRDGRYLPQRASLDLTDLLEQCVLRIRGQANNARVIVRNAISERLPRITADRASLAQAVLNLLASAIDQTHVGGAVVISAQRHDDGSIAIHVRDSSQHAVDMAERFVVFRDGPDRNGKMLAPVRSSVGLALTRSLLAVNAVSFSVDPAGAEGMLFTMRIPADLVDDQSQAQEAD